MKRIVSILILILAAVSCGNVFANSTPLRQCERTEEELAFIQQEAQRGDAQAQFDLAKQYRIGLCFREKNNDELAFSWLEKAADQGLLEAQLELASSYIRGAGVKQDSGKGLEIYHQLARQNFAMAQFELGDFYMAGSLDGDIHPDVSKALFWYETAANQKMVQAMNRLGSLYRDKERTFHNLDISSSWFRKAAEETDVFAMIELAENLLKSNLDESKQEATEWYRRAAELGASKAQYALAESYALGRGIERDYEKAYLWYRIARASGSSNPEFEKEIKAQLTGAQILAAEKEAKEYRQTHLSGPVIVKDQAN